MPRIATSTTGLDPSITKVCRYSSHLFSVSSPMTTSSALRCPLLPPADLQSCFSLAFFSRQGLSPLTGLHRFVLRCSGATCCKSQVRWRDHHIYPVICSCQPTHRPINPRCSHLGADVSGTCSSISPSPSIATCLNHEFHLLISSCPSTSPPPAPTSILFSASLPPPRSHLTLVLVSRSASYLPPWRPSPSPSASC
eukprot:766173-Hanusia_phi.AAC.2